MRLDKECWLYGVVVLIFLLSSCTKDEDAMSQNDPYEIVLENGIFVEQFPESVTDENRYNQNNEIFKLDTELEYSFYHEDTSGDRFYFELDEGALDLPTPIERNKAWFYVPEDAITKKTITSLRQTIKSGLEPFIERLPDYNQTVFSLFYVSQNNDSEVGESTGLIENERNVWMHPPRQMMFRILELNPFPYIQAPYEIGNTWEWNYLRPDGESWSDDRWLVWTGELNVNCSYEITSIDMLETKVGNLECYEITSVANTQYGDTELKGYFNKQFGFVRLEYLNINKTKTVIEIESFSR